MTFITNAIEKKGFAKSPALAWMVFFSGGLLFFYEFIQLNMFNALNTSLMKAFNLNAQQLGHLGSTYFIANAGLLFVAGNLLDRVSTRKLIIFAMLCCTIGTLGFAISNSAFEAGIFRFVVGIGGSFCFLSGVKLASRWFPVKRMALATGLLVTMAMVGGLVAQAPLTALVQSFGWREATILNGALGVVITAWIFFTVKDHPVNAQAQLEDEERHHSEFSLWQSILSVISKPQNWLAGFYTCLMNLPIYLLGALWGTMFLQQAHHYTPTDSAFIAGMVFMGTIFGSPAMGWISDRMGNRKLPMMIGAILSLVVVMFIIYGTALSYGAMLALFFALGFITSTQVISYPLVAEGSPRALTGTAVSIVSLMCVLSGAVMQPFSGWLLDLNWAGKMCGGAHCYSLAAYQHAMWIFPISFFISLVLVFFMKETHCKHVDEMKIANQAGEEIDTSSNYETMQEV